MKCFEDWLEFTFTTNGPTSLLQHDDFTGSDEELAEHCLELFQSFDQSVKTVPDAQIDAALRIIPGVDGYLGVIASSEVNFDLRKRLVRAHVRFFESCFPDRFPNVAFMWWEWLSGASYKGGPGVSGDATMCGMVWEVLQQILFWDSRSCQMSALHGLNEFGFGNSGRDPRPIIERFLKKSTIEVEVIKYAQEVQSGRAL